MKTIENRQTEMPFKENDGEQIKQATYFDLVRYCLNQTPQGGFTFEEMRRRLRILEAISSAPESAALEDADLDKLKECVTAARWLSLDKTVVEFSDYIRNL